MRKEQERVKPIYKPKGKAKEYGDLALNIYTGCTHGCTYCYAPSVLRKSREDFTKVEPRKNIVNEVKKQLKREQIKDQLIHLCFTCDPYPTGIDTTPTREIIKAIKESGNHVQILTKGGTRAVRDFDLLDENDWFGVTITCNLNEAKKREPNAALPGLRLDTLGIAKSGGIRTWVSCEPVYEPETIFALIEVHGEKIDLYRIGKLNYEKSEINWHDFGHECERLCKEYGRSYYIKEGLRAEMEGAK